MMNHGPAVAAFWLDIQLATALWVMANAFVVSQWTGLGFDKLQLVTGRPIIVGTKEINRLMNQSAVGRAKSATFKSKVAFCVSRRNRRLIESTGRIFIKRQHKLMENYYGGKKILKQRTAGIGKKKKRTGCERRIRHNLKDVLILFLSVESFSRCFNAFKDFLRSMVHFRCIAQTI